MLRRSLMQIKLIMHEWWDWRVKTHRNSFAVVASSYKRAINASPYDISTATKNRSPWWRYENCSQLFLKTNRPYLCWMRQWWETRESSLKSETLPRFLSSGEELLWSPFLVGRSVCLSVKKSFKHSVREFQWKSEDQRGQPYLVSSRNIFKQAWVELGQAQDNLSCGKTQNTKFQIAVCGKYSCKQWKTISIWF